ncbi:hypothetical protein DFJ73DRAFT_838668, partial [Zopfochytrium polystomum]
MLWPSNLSIIEMHNSLHESNTPRADGKLKLSTRLLLDRHGLIFLWEWFPLFIMPVLASISLLCYV